MGDRIIENANFEEIEDEYDALVAKEAYEEYKKDPETYSLEEIRKSLGI
ncbi:MAG: DUF6290 family protein [Oscillospiraceae bacterium]|nr:DUF6290 family protein [Oscillospiraceae bacterium]